MFGAQNFLYNVFSFHIWPTNAGFMDVLMILVHTNLNFYMKRKTNYTLSDLAIGKDSDISDEGAMVKVVLANKIGQRKKIV